jgi:hypothetical protein
MVESNTQVCFPCFTGNYDDQPGKIPALVNQQGRRCLGLFTATHLVEEFFEAYLRDKFTASLLEVVPFRRMDELSDYLDARWPGLVARNVFHVVTDPMAESAMPPEAIYNVLNKVDGDRFNERTRHRPHHDWSSIPVNSWEFLPIRPAESFVDVGAFFLRADGSLRLAEGREISEYPDGWFYYTDDDDKDFCELLISKSTICMSGGTLSLRSDKLRLAFVFEANDKSKWEYKYDISEGTWYERKLRETAD